MNAKEIALRYCRSTKLVKKMVVDIEDLVCREIVQAINQQDTHWMNIINEKYENNL